MKTKHPATCVRNTLDEVCDFSQKSNATQAAK